MGGSPKDMRDLGLMEDWRWEVQLKIGGMWDWWEVGGSPKDKLDVGPKGSWRWEVHVKICGMWVRWEVGSGRLARHS